MKKYKVVVLIEETNIYEVQAKSTDEARELVLSGNQEPVKVQDAGWDVVDIEEINQ